MRNWPDEILTHLEPSLSETGLAVHRAVRIVQDQIDQYPNNRSLNTPPPAGHDPLSKLALHALAFLEADFPVDRSQIGFIVTMRWGSLETDLAFDRTRHEANGRYASPALFSRTLPSTVPAECALKYGLTGPSLVLVTENTPEILLITRARDWMRPLGLMACLAGNIDWRGDVLSATFYLVSYPTV